jgi:hypothetical protein
MAWTLCSKTDVMDIHPIPQTELKDSWSDEVEDLIRQHLGAPYLGLTQEIVDEYYDGDGTVFLRVRKPPIISVEAISISGVALTSDDYVVFPTQIQLKDRVFPRGNLNVRLSYTSGSEVIPGSVRICAAAMIAAIINYRKRMGSDASLKWGAPLDMKVGEESPSQNIGLTSHLVTIMKRTLRRPRIRVH